TAPARAEAESRLAEVLRPGAPAQVRTADRLAAMGSSCRLHLVQMRQARTGLLRQRGRLGARPQMVQWLHSSRIFRSPSRQRFRFRPTHLPVGQSPRMEEVPLAREPDILTPARLF